MLHQSEVQALRRRAAERPDGVSAEAVLHTTPHVHNLFSSTEAPFQVTNRHYHELSDFLHSIMPSRPLGLHYSTIGFHHVSKVAVMNEVRRQLTRHREQLDIAPGSLRARSPSPLRRRARPTCSRSSATIRPRVYKWDSFEGVDAVLGKYKRVHEINRTGSMLDNILYYNLKLDCAWFDPNSWTNCCKRREQRGAAAGRRAGLQVPGGAAQAHAAQCVPDVAPEDKASRAMVNLGLCIRNNAAANVFNKDFDVRNYGVSRYLKVYLYDYDARRSPDRVKVRTNLRSLRRRGGRSELVLRVGGGVSAGGNRIGSSRRRPAAAPRIPLRRTPI